MLVMLIQHVRFFFKRICNINSKDEFEILNLRVFSSNDVKMAYFGTSPSKMKKWFLGLL